MADELNESKNLSLEDVHALISDVIRNVREIKLVLSGQPMPKKLADAMKKFEDRVARFENVLKTKASSEELLSSAKSITIYATIISSSLSQNVPEELRNRVARPVQRLRYFFDHREVILGPEGHPLIDDTNDENALLKLEENLKIEKQLNSLKQRLKSLSDKQDEFEKTNQRQTESIANQLYSLTNQAEKKLNEADKVVENRLQLLQENIDTKLKEVQALYVSTQGELENKKQEIAELVSAISGDAIAGDFAKSAKNEKDMADRLRTASVGLMLAIAFLVAYSLYETTKTGFQLETSVFRLVFSMLLSIPAAYLARESAKHRQQQYTHLQTSLDLKAIAPYLASLPEVDRNKLKSEIAHRLFGTRTAGGNSHESFPINVQELILALISKLEFPFRQQGNDTKAGR